MKNLIVSEHFYSLQGEGKFTGVPSIFLRLTGCNLKCGFRENNRKGSWICDTREVWIKGIKYNTNDLIELFKENDYISKLNKGNVHLIITGGEPLLQQNELYIFLKELTKLVNKNFIIEIETNGTKFETDNIKLAELISEISQDFTLEDLEETMPYNQTELTNFKELLDFDWNKFSPTEDNDLEEEKEDLEEKEVNLKFVELKLNITDEVYSIWEQWKKTIKTNLNDMNLSDNKCFEFALAEALSTIKEVKDE